MITVGQWKKLLREKFDDRWGLTQKYLAYVKPADRHVVTGVFADRSGSPGFYLEQFRLPLYSPPDDVLDLSWCDRVGGGSRLWQFDEPGVVSAVQGAMDQALTEDALEWTVIPAEPGDSEGGHVMETRGYGLLLEGNIPGAIECLVRVERLLSPDIDWQVEMKDRVVGMRELLEDDRAEEALAVLAGWREQNLDLLGIETS